MLFFVDMLIATPSPVELSDREEPQMGKLILEIVWRIVWFQQDLWSR